MFEFGRECVRIRAGRTYNPATDENDMLDWSEAAVSKLPVPGSIIAPGSMTEPVVDDEDNLVIQMSFYGPYDADLRHLDRITDPGLLDEAGAPIVWQVVGDIAGGQWMNPYTGWTAGCEIPVKQVR